jgi:GNAT superfamily N-acetyltransferase
MASTQTWTRGEFRVSTDRTKIDGRVVHDFLTHSYWSEGIPRDVVERSIRGSLCFGVYQGAKLIGFARVISDRATFAYLADVFILEEFRGRGLGRWLMECIMVHPELQNLRRWSLLTRDAHSLYEKFGFTAPKLPERHMERSNPDIYKRKKQ